MQIKLHRKNSPLELLVGINRPIVPSHATRLATSVKLMGQIRPIIIAYLSFIDGVYRHYIIDGQHLSHALLRFDMPMYVLEIQIKNTKELVEKIALLNASSKSWTYDDYIKAWSAVSDEYKKLQKYYHTYDFDLGTLATILSNKTAVHNGGKESISRTIKSGAFKVEDEEKSVKMLDDITDVLEILARGNRVENRYLCSEYYNFRKGLSQKYTHSTFLSNVKKNKRSLDLAIHGEDKLSNIFKRFI
jgi:hypothetical protein